MVRYAALMVLGLSAVVSAETHRWVSSNGNFGAAQSWTSGIAPANWLPTDDVVFDGLSQVSAGTGMQQQAVRVRSITTTNGYNGTIGWSADPLRIDADSFTFVSDGTNSLWYSPPSNERLRVVVIDTVGDATLGGMISHLFVKAGYVDVLAFAQVDNVIVSGSSYLPERLDIAHSDPPLKSLTMESGYVINNRRVAAGSRIVLTGGDLQQRGRFESQSELLMTGGALTYAPPGVPPPATVRMDIVGGVLDLGDTYQEIEASTGYLTLDATVFLGPLRSLDELRIIDLAANFPDASVWDWSDNDADGVAAAIDSCPATVAGESDTNGDCTVDLFDFYLLQQEFTGP